MQTMMLWNVRRLKEAELSPGSALWSTELTVEHCINNTQQCRPTTLSNTQKKEENPRGPMKKGPSLVKPVFILLACIVRILTNILVLLKYETLI